MFCTRCGKPIADGSRFCGYCGAAQNHSQPQAAVPAPKVKKKSHKGLIIGIVALCAVIVIAAGAAVMFLWPEGDSAPAGSDRVQTSSPTQEQREQDSELVTVWRPVYHKVTLADGPSSEQEFRYDEDGRVLQWPDWRILYPWYEVKYDEFGNITQWNNCQSGGYSSTSYQYTYDESGRIVECRENDNGEQAAIWDFTWDDRGNLVQVMRTGDLSYGYTPYPRGDFEYDRKGRLVCEYLAYGEYYGPDGVPQELSVYRFEYSYDILGNVESVMCTVSEKMTVTPAEIDPKNLEYELVDSCKFNRNLSGQLISCECLNPNLDTPFIFPYTYDENGNLDLSMHGDEVRWNEHGNVLYCRWNGSSVREIEYEEVELTAEQAENYRRWESLLNLDYKRNLDPVDDSPIRHGDIFYYHLIPNPIW